jgi:hypothetical protein
MFTVLVCQYRMMIYVNIYVKIYVMIYEMIYVNIYVKIYVMIYEMIYVKIYVRIHVVILCEFTFVMKGFSGHRNVFLYKGLWLCRLLQFWERWRFDG